MIRNINFLLYLFLKWLGDTLIQSSITIEKAALTCYTKGLLNKPWHNRKMDSTIYITVYRTMDNVIHVAAIYVDDYDVDGMMNRLALKERAKVLFHEDLGYLPS